MSVCWVVEPVEPDAVVTSSTEEKTSENDYAQVAEFDVKDKGKSKEHHTNESELCRSGKGKNEEEDEDEDEEEERITKLLVLGKVRGLWKLAEYPTHEYAFI
jgi:hypothetical protein